jgi:oxygen-independent coproporphyrinogen-3 oxidase
MNPPALNDIAEETLLALVRRLDVPGPRYTSYPTVPVWSDSFPAGPYLDKLAGIDAAFPLALYLHLPYCRRRCRYCGCNSVVSSDAGMMGRYASALESEIDRVAARLPAGVRHAWLHLGGGTPTHLPPVSLEGVLRRLIEKIPGAEHPERSVEVDPRVTTEAHLRLLSEAGFSRISIGIQDLDERVQRAVNRLYPLEKLRSFVERCRRFGFSSINIDLIYGLPKQTRAGWRLTLEQVLDLTPERVACFGYAHLPRRMPHQRTINEADLPAPNDRLGMLLDANRFVTGRGLVPIGLDHFAVETDELAAARRSGRLWRNFMGYTSIKGLEMIGLGCSAISEFAGLYVQNIVPPDDYIKAVESGEWPVRRGIELDEDDRLRKMIINHLMCNLRIEPPPGPAGSGDGARRILAEADGALQLHLREGLIVPENGGYQVTPLGQLFLRNLAMPFDRYLKPGQTPLFSRTV